MYFTTVRLQSLSNVDLKVVGATPLDAFICKGIDGLGPAEIDVAIANTPHQGGVYQNSIPHLKEIVVRIGLNPEWGGQTPADLRAYLYGLITGNYTGNNVSIILLDHTDPDPEDVIELCRITGYIKKFEINPFSKDPEVQITFGCLSPYFQSQDRYQVDVDEINPITNVRFDSAPSFQNIGTAPTGVRLQFDINSELEDTHIRDQAGSLYMRFSFLPMLDAMPGALVEGGVMTIDTTPGARFATFWPEVHSSWWDFNLMGSMVGRFDWLQLYGGTNYLHVGSTTYGGDCPDSDIGWLEISYMPTYWGI